MAIKAETKSERDASKLALGWQIKAAREAAGLKQEGVALAAGIKQSELSMVENGKRALSWFGYQKLADAIGCGLEGFRVPEEQMSLALRRITRRLQNGLAGESRAS